MIPVHAASETKLFAELSRINNQLVAMHRELAKSNEELSRTNGLLREEVARREKAERDLAERSAALSRSNAQLTEFAFVASHDLEEPLRTIGRFAELLERQYRPQLDKNAGEYLAFISAGVDRMGLLIDGLLTCARVESCTRPHVPTDCNAVLSTTIKQLGAMIESSGADVSSGQLPIIDADPVQIGQVFQNLVSNGIRFRSSRPPVVRVEAQRRDRNWIFAVSDNGMGIDPAGAERLFRVFGRLHSADEYPGAGIGLALCKQIIARHGGRIWFDSQPGDGATFYFMLPINDDAISAT